MYSSVCVSFVAVFIVIQFIVFNVSGANVVFFIFTDGTILAVGRGRSFLLFDTDILLEVVSHVSVLQVSHRRFGEDVRLTVCNGLHQHLVHLLFSLSL